MAAESEPGQGKSRRADVSYPLITNGLDYLLDVVDRLATDPGEAPDARALKYAVLHLQAAAEVFLKARLQHEHWTLVFKNPAAATRKDFDSAEFESCTTGEAFTRLTQIAGLDLPDKAVAAVKRLARDRNALQHYGLTAPAAAVEARAADVLNFLLPFISDQLVPGLDKNQKADVEQTMSVVRGQVRGIEAYLKKRMNEIRADLQDVQDCTVVCPECAQQALVLSADLPACRFCLKTWDDPEETAVEYVFQVHGLDPVYSDVDEAVIQVCPDCEFNAMVHAETAAAPDEQRLLCFSCAADFTDANLPSCEAGCGRALPAGSEDLLCPDCTSSAYDRF
ncbi:hypothetical protein ABZ656_18680 [Streptomyces sp. NPDC007095]|jgi:transposase-like protein|uniref:hypothetical protein n=1 Tax=Streptomyces sp. NPDC007095 TaxID=3154482 RepID=UPI000C710807